MFNRLINVQKINNFDRFIYLLILLIDEEDPVVCTMEEMDREEAERLAEISRRELGIPNSSQDRTRGNQRQEQFRETPPSPTTSTPASPNKSKQKKNNKRPHSSASLSLGFWQFFCSHEQGDNECYVSEHREPHVRSSGGKSLAG